MLARFGPGWELGAGPDLSAGYPREQDVEDDLQSWKRDAVPHQIDQILWTGAWTTNLLQPLSDRSVVARRMDSMSR